MGSVVGVPDAGKAASLATDAKWEEMTLPKGSSLTLTKFGAVAATPDKPAQPAREVTEVKLSEPTAWKKTENVFQADTGTVDTSIAKHRIDVASSAPLLYGALAAALAAGVFLWMKYPTPAFICAGAAVVLFIAWKVAEAPAWLWAIGLAGIAAAVFLYLGHERGELHAKGQAPQ